MWWMMLMACTAELSVTGESGMVGQLLDDRGQPVLGAVIESVEAKTRTDASGRFAIAYKKPSEYVHFRRGLLWYRRSLRAADLGKLVQLRLPSTRTAELRCPVQCDAKLVWTLAPGFVAQQTGKCGPKKPLILLDVPQSAPELLCRMTPSDQKWVIDDRGVVIDAVRLKGEDN